MPALQGGNRNPAPRRAGVRQSSQGPRDTPIGFNANSFAMNLQSRQALNRRDTAMAGESGFQNTMRGDTGLRDEQLGGSSEASVLDTVRTRSYTDDHTTELEAPMAGGGLMASHALALDETRQREAEMRRTQAQFVGEPRSGSSPEINAPADSSAQETDETEDTNEDEDEEEEEQEDAEQSEQQAAFQMQSDQQQQTQAKNSILEQLQNDSLSKLQFKMAKKTMQTAARGSMEIMDIAGSEVVLPLFLLVLQLNVQMINKYIFTPMLFQGWNEDVDVMTEGAPFFGQSNPEVALTVFIDFLIITPCLLIMSIPIIIIAAIGSATGGTFDIISTVARVVSD